MLQNLSSAAVVIGTLRVNDKGIARQVVISPETLLVPKLGPIFCQSADKV